ncbi:restriction endonuclease-like protein [Syntrophaceticus schinkii]|jgi:hypothetical protein|uniref:DUF2357 domain-containing protein n=1 Tax=Syntrophaceticus schinkii TaxID=499207 RepID=A0A0B7MS25_9FIRM|nr:restriction endonuclease-like protein [Syntrophaceticus schinkii]CEO90487.1 conserved hypothetical protein [Syntrophaceticus schinkii]
MKLLFELQSDRVHLKFSQSVYKEPAILPNKDAIGRLVLTQHRTNLVWHKVWRQGLPPQIENCPKQHEGPCLFEETNYKLYARCNSGFRLDIEHPDPVIISDLDHDDQHSTVYGYINFGSQVGYSEFTVLVDGKPEFSFQVEVFPSKLDYASDYEEILASVQDIMTGLAMEYLRSTYQTGTTFTVSQSTDLEWFILLRGLIDELEKALNYIARKPLRGLKREQIPVRAEKIKHINGRVLAAVRRGAGRGGFTRTKNNIPVREYIYEDRPQSTLDTVEHRWLSRQLYLIQQRLNQLRLEERQLYDTPRRRKALQELGDMGKRILRLQGLEPLAAAASGEIPQGFVSLQLLRLPGYREAYKYCLALSLGLRIEGGPLQLSVKDLSLLYEYWCYLALLRLISEETGQQIPVKELFAVQQNGLRVLLNRGQEQRVCFPSKGGGHITATYNPSFRGEAMLIPQRPDMVITLENKGWPAMHLVLDAKYRLDASPDYIDRYKSAGPPEDALNSMHRYRDAILEFQSRSDESPVQRRTVVQAAAVFPGGITNVPFCKSRLWKALRQIGVGALPFLPANKEYVREWLRSRLKMGGFSIAEHTLPHSIYERARDWHSSAAEPVVVGTLSAGNQRQHLQWIIDKQLYYMPMLKTQLRQYATKWVAIYSPQEIRSPGAVTHYAQVKSIEIVQRKEILTPWPPKRNLEEPQVLFILGEVFERKIPIINTSGYRFTQHRWTSRLGLERAYNLEQLLLETEPEWRLFEDLTALGVKFTLDPSEPVRLLDKDNPYGRVWFRLDDGSSIRYAGASGYVIRRIPGGRPQYFVDYQELMGEIVMTSLG